MTGVAAAAADDGVAAAYGGVAAADDRVTAADDDDVCGRRSARAVHRPHVNALLEIVIQ